MAAQRSYFAGVAGRYYDNQAELKEAVIANNTVGLAELAAAQAEISGLWPQMDAMPSGAAKRRA